MRKKWVFKKVFLNNKRINIESEGNENVLTIN